MRKKRFQLPQPLSNGRASLEWLKVSNSNPDVVHVHEWQTAAVPMLFWDLYSPAMQKARLMLTIHNLDSQGECRQEEFAATGALFIVLFLPLEQL